MSLYNMLHGMNPLAPTLLAMLGIDQDDKKWSSGRFRDIFPSADGKQIFMLTRNGGGNREHWGEEYGESGPKCSCSGCVITHHLPKHPNYVRDYDDDFDCTYAYVVFETPEQYLPVMKLFADGKEPATLKEKFDKAMEYMKSRPVEELKKHPGFAKLIEVVEEIAKVAKKD